MKHLLTYFAATQLETFCTVNKSSCLKSGILILVLWWPREQADTDLCSFAAYPIRECVRCVGSIVKAGLQGHVVGGERSEAPSP